MNSLALHLDVTVLILCSGSTGSHLETFIMDRQEVKDQDNEHKKIIDNRLRPGSTCVFARGGHVGASHNLKRTLGVYSINIEGLSRYTLTHSSGSMPSSFFAGYLCK